MLMPASLVKDDGYRIVRYGIQFNQTVRNGSSTGSRARSNTAFNAYAGESSVTIYATNWTSFGNSIIHAQGVVDRQRVVITGPNSYRATIQFNSGETNSLLIFKHTGTYSISAEWRYRINGITREQWLATGSIIVS